MRYMKIDCKLSVSNANVNALSTYKIINTCCAREILLLTFLVAAE